MATDNEQANEQDKKLIRQALSTRENAYAPYSNFKVGACVLFESGNSYCGCNVENSSFGATNCAERTAIFSGVAKGEIARNSKIKKIVIAGGKNGQNLDFCPPCGICLQVIAEFSRNSNVCEVVLVKTEIINGQHKVTETVTHKLADLLPMSFALQAR